MHHILGRGGHMWFICQDGTWFGRRKLLPRRRKGMKAALEVGILIFHI